MPTYSYECKKCGQVDNVYHGMNAKPKVTCSACKSTAMKKLLGTGAGIIFKGSGFYETDYKNGGKKAAKSDSKSEGKSESKSDSSGSGSESKSPASESKSDSKKSDSTATKPASKTTSAA